MRVASSSITPFEAPGGRPGIALAIVDDAGHVGLGEAAPLPGFSRDDVGGARAALDAARARLGAIDDAGAARAVVERAMAPLEGPTARAPSARFALETALIDLVARARGVPVRVALGGARPYDRVRVNGLARADAGADALVAAGLRVAARGLGAIKVKLRARDDEGFARELEALERLRAACPDLELRLDANAAWTLDEAPRRLAAIARVGPRYVEQPVPPGALARLRAPAAPVAADESLVDPAEADAVFAADACAAYVVKPALVGGALRALDLAARAATIGRDVVVTHAFDGAVGFALACEVALALGRAPLACGLDPEGALPAADAGRVPQIDEPGVVRGVDRPGLGLRCAR